MAQNRSSLSLKGLRLVSTRHEIIYTDYLIYLTLLPAVNYTTYFGLFDRKSDSGECHRVSMKEPVEHFGQALSHALDNKILGRKLHSNFDKNKNKVY